MKSVHDEAGRESIVSKLFPEIVGMAREHCVGAVAEVRGKRCSGAHGMGDLRSRSARVADTRDHPLLHDAFDEAWSLGPLGRKRNQADVSAGGVLKAAKLLEIGRPDPARRMCAARAVVR